MGNRRPPPLPSFRKKNHSLSLSLSLGYHDDFFFFLSSHDPPVMALARRVASSPKSKRPPNMTCLPPRSRTIMAMVWFREVRSRYVSWLKGGQSSLSSAAAVAAAARDCAG